MEFREHHVARGGGADDDTKRARAVYVDVHVCDCEDAMKREAKTDVWQPLCSLPPIIVQHDLRNKHTQPLKELKQTIACQLE